MLNTDRVVQMIRETKESNIVDIGVADFLELCERALDGLEEAFVYDFKNGIESVSEKHLVLAITDHREIAAAFTWRGSPQGVDYWAKIYDKGHTARSVRELTELLRQFREDRAAHCGTGE